MDFMNLLLEGSNYDNDTVDVEEAVDAVNRTHLPLSTLIETVCSDIQIGLIKAEEVYEMACVVGGVQVVSEGTGSAGASVIMENAIKNFFGAIAEKFRQLWNWIVGIFNSIKDKFKKGGKEIKKEVDKIEPQVKEKIKTAKKQNKPIKIPETINILDATNGENIAVEMMSSINKFLNDDSVITPNDKWSEEEFREIKDADLSVKGIIEKMRDEIGIKNVETLEDLKGVVRNAYGIGEIKRNTGELTEKEYGAMKSVVDLAAKDNVAHADKLCKDIENRCKYFEKQAKIFSMKAPDDARAKVFFSKTQTMLNSMSNIFTTLINERASIILNAANSYKRFLVHTVMTKDEMEAAQDSTDYSIFFESKDIIEDTGDDVSENYCAYTGESVLDFLGLASY